MVNVMKSIECSVAVVGSGSGGIGAALAASRLGVDTVLIEKESMLGGTSVVAGVSCWEPVAGATGIPYDIYHELVNIPKAVGIYSMGRHCCHPEHNNPPFPGGESLVGDKSYRDTLLRSGTRGLKDDEQLCREQWHGVVFEPEQFDMTVRKMLEDTGRCRIISNNAVVAVNCNNSSEIASVTLADGTVVKAGLWIDNSGALIRFSGAGILIGEDPKSLFNEPGAPDLPKKQLNGATLIFRITTIRMAEIEPRPDYVPASCWWADRFPSMFCVQYPNGDRNCNMLPTMSGKEYIELGETKAYAECVRRVRSFWHYLQSEYPEFRNYRIKHIFERIGVRESFRTVCNYMLNENDLLQGISRQQHSDIIALSDHMMDSHGAQGRKSGELHEPYGVPYRCLIPQGFDNLLVAGRIAGFSSIAASSCRLSRTMMQLGQAAGTAAALAIEKNCLFPEVDIQELRSSLIHQRVQLH